MTASCPALCRAYVHFPPEVHTLIKSFCPPPKDIPLKIYASTFRKGVGQSLNKQIDDVAPYVENWQSDEPINGCIITRYNRGVLEERKFIRLKLLRTEATLKALMDRKVLLRFNFSGGKVGSSQILGVKNMRNLRDPEDDKDRFQVRLQLWNEEPKRENVGEGGRYFEGVICIWCDIQYA